MSSLTEMTKSMKIFIARHGETYGPFTPEAVETLLRNRQVSRDDSAWTDDLPNWIPLGQLLNRRPDNTTSTKPNDPDPAPAPKAAEPAAAPSPVITRKREPVNLRRLAAIAGCVAGFVLLMVILAIPDHVSIEPSGSSLLKPDAGYTWIDRNDSFNWKVQWTPGRPHRTLANVLAAEEEGDWQPAPGYIWRDEASRAEAVWLPSARLKAFPHVMTGVNPREWIGDPGYKPGGNWSSRNPEFVWSSGVRDPRFPHVESSFIENSWNIDSGYSFTSDATTLSPTVVWTPGRRHRDSPHAYAASVEGRWMLDAGYVWFDRNDPNDFRAIRPARIVDIWNEMIRIDTAVSRIGCGSIENGIRAARAAYGELDASESHPLLETHVRNARIALINTATALENCQAADDATNLVDVAFTFGCLFADDPDQCRQNGDVIVGGGGLVISAACRAAARNAREELDRVTAERREVQRNLESAYNLTLPVTELVACR